MIEISTIVQILNVVNFSILSFFTGQITVVDEDTMEEEEGGLTMLPAVCGFMALVNFILLIVQGGY